MDAELRSIAAARRAAEQAWDDAWLVVQIGGDQDNAME